MEAPQYVSVGITELLPTNVITKYIIKYQTIETINPNNAFVKNTLMNIDYAIKTKQNSQ